MSGISRWPKLYPRPVIESTAENYYQHAKHYFRSMAAAKGTP